MIKILQKIGPIIVKYNILKILNYTHTRLVLDNTLSYIYINKYRISKPPPKEPMNPKTTNNWLQRFKKL